MSEKITSEGEKIAFLKEFQKSQNISTEVQSSLLWSVVENCGTPVTVSDHTDKDEVLIYCNKAFEDMTGYTYDEVIGKNCRFLQGEKTNKDDVQTIKEALSANDGCEVSFVNYRKDGSAFWNKLSMSPVVVEGKVLFYLGLQNFLSEYSEE